MDSNILGCYEITANACLDRIFSNRLPRSAVLDVKNRKTAMLSNFWRRCTTWQNGELIRERKTPRLILLFAEWQVYVNRWSMNRQSVTERRKTLVNTQKSAEVSLRREVHAEKLLQGSPQRKHTEVDQQIFVGHRGQPAGYKCSEARSAENNTPRWARRL